MSYHIYDNEEYTVDWESRIPSINQDKDKRSSGELKCANIDLYADDTKIRSSLEVWCEPINWNLYELSEQFDWCPSPMASYLLATPANNVAEYLAGVCYNIDQQQILIVNYAAAHHLSKHEYPASLENYLPSVKIQQVPSKFISDRINTTHLNNVEIREWMQFAQYENHSLIQDPNLYENVHEDKFGGLLELNWWPNLRSGNWRLYEKALREHIEADKEIYDIFAGVSGAVAVPSHEKGSNGIYSMVYVTYGAEQKIPLYVWQYLRSQKDDGSEVVVIGVNSPFTDLLKSVQSTFHYKIMGLIFCSDANEVKLSERLDGFPFQPEPQLLPLPLKRIQEILDDFNEPILTEIETNVPEYSEILKE